jgi:hypothetical protein
MFAFLSEEGPGEEGLVARLLGGAWLPLVGANMARVESLKRIAQEIANQTAKPIVIAKFETRTNIERIEPEEIDLADCR